MTPNTGVYVACVPVSLRHACLYRCRLLQRDQHDAVFLLVSCLLVFVLHVCSCLYRNWQRGSKEGVRKASLLEGLQSQAQAQAVLEVEGSLGTSGTSGTGTPLEQDSISGTPLEQGLQSFDDFTLL